MSLIEDRHTADLDGHRVAVRGRTGKVHATWTLLVDEEEVDSASAPGDFALRGELPSGRAVEAAVHQSLVGPTKVTIRLDGEDVETHEGFVL